MRPEDTKTIDEAAFGVIDGAVTVMGILAATGPAANGPTLAMILAAVGIFSVGTGLVVAQVLAISLLVFYGARIGFRLYHRVGPALKPGGFSRPMPLGNPHPTV